jgi:pimeloyl-ACP methyl ester carboxylesterase
MTGFEMTLIRLRLRRCGFRVYRFPYRSLRRGLEVNGEVLAEFAAKVPGDTVHFVGHSLGGLVIRRMLADHPQPRLGRVVTLGTPHRGSRVACALAASPWGRRILGLSRHALTSEQDLPVPDYPLGVIAGNVPVGIGRLFTRLPEPHDGTVCLDEAGVEGAADYWLGPVSHTSMLFSAPVTQQICRFLREGHFEQSES